MAPEGARRVHLHLLSESVRVIPSPSELFRVRPSYSESVRVLSSPSESIRADRKRRRTGLGRPAGWQAAGPGWMGWMGCEQPLCRGSRPYL